MLQTIQQTADFIKSKITETPETGIILGTGLGALADDIEEATAISYEEIPNFPVSTVEGHSGKLIIGKLNGKPVVAMQGRFHFYEGYSMQEIVFPVRVMKFLGIKRLFLSNACGGVNPNYVIGDMMLINDHINLFPTNPLIGKNLDELGPRFPDMSEPYSNDLLELAEKIAQENKISIQKGVYAGLSGPCLETPAEYNYIYKIGADVVGMSTVPEVIAARHMNIPCFAVSVITDLGIPGKIQFVTHEDVQRAAEIVQPKLSFIVKKMVASL